MLRTTTIGFIDGSDADQRFEVSLNQSADGQLQLGMSEQHFAEGIGWFTQRSLSLNPDQVAQLKRLLGVSNLRSSERGSTKPQSGHTLKLHHRPPNEDHTFSEVG